MIDTNYHWVRFVKHEDAVTIDTNYHWVRFVKWFLSALILEPGENMLETGSATIDPA